MHCEGPIVDEKNPLYCPTLTAVTFLKTIRHQLLSDPPPYSRAPQERLPSFAYWLEQSLDEAGVYHLFPPLTAGPEHGHGPDLSTALEEISSLATWYQSTPAPRPSRAAARDPPGVRAKRKRSLAGEMDGEHFSDLLAPPKRERSSQSVNDGSFVLSAKAERLRYFRPAVDVLFSPQDIQREYQDCGELSQLKLERRIHLLEDQLYGPRIGTDSPRGISSFVSRLHELLPGMRLKERLYALGAHTHQLIADNLAIDGHLNARVLDMFRMSEIERLDLTASLMDEEGLNYGAREILQVLARPNSFLFLQELSLSGASLSDSDMIHVHHLPRLSRLWVSNAGIGNEAIYHLVALRRTLTELDIALNPAVDDDAIPALSMLSKLCSLSLFDTSIRMPGLRRLAVAFGNKIKEKAIDIEMPRECEEYIDNLHKKYLLNPKPPLISDPAVCETLSVAALRLNLAEHAVYNPSGVLVGGSQREMAERLERILKIQEQDLLVRQLAWQRSEKSDHDADVDVKEDTSGWTEEVF